MLGHLCLNIALMITEDYSSQFDELNKKLEEIRQLLLSNLHDTNVEDNDEFISVAVGAKLLNRSRTQMYTYLREGKLPFYRFEDSPIKLKKFDVVNAYKIVKPKFQNPL